jgi:type IV pilus assembly protein PilV
MVGRHSVQQAGSGGFSLIEMLVATTVLSFGMGGMAALMLSASAGMVESEHQSIASLQAAGMVATLQLGPAALEHLANPPASAPLCFESDACTPEEWLTGQYLSWRSGLSRDLPGGTGVVCSDSTPMDGDADDPQCDGTGPVVSKVFWIETRHEQEVDGGHRRAVMQVPR